MNNTNILNFSLEHIRILRIILKVNILQTLVESYKFHFIRFHWCINNGDVWKWKLISIALNKHCVDHVRIKDVLKTAFPTDLLKLVKREWHKSKRNWRDTSLYAKKFYKSRQISAIVVSVWLYRRLCKRNSDLM